MEARQFYHVLNEVLHEAAPKYSQALNVGEKLRRMGEQRRAQRARDRVEGRVRAE